jgi:hypothetical protein
MRTLPPITIEPIQTTSDWLSPELKRLAVQCNKQQEAAQATQNRAETVIVDDAAPAATVRRLTKARRDAEFDFLQAYLVAIDTRTDFVNRALEVLRQREGEAFRELAKACQGIANTLRHMGLGGYESDQLSTRRPWHATHAQREQHRKYSALLVSFGHERQRLAKLHIEIAGERNTMLRQIGRA